MVLSTCTQLSESVCVKYLPDVCMIAHCVLSMNWMNTIYFIWYHGISSWPEYSGNMLRSTKRTLMYQQDVTAKTCRNNSENQIFKNYQSLTSNCQNKMSRNNKLQRKTSTISQPKTSKTYQSQAPNCQNMMSRKNQRQTSNMSQNNASKNWQSQTPKCQIKMST